MIKSNCKKTIENTGRTQLQC